MGGGVSRYIVKTVMLLLNLANYYNWKVSTADISTAFWSVKLRKRSGSLFHIV